MTGDNDQGRSLSQSQNQSSYGGQGSRRPLSDGAPNLPHQQSTDDMSYDQNASYQVMSQTRTQQGTESSRPGGTQTYWQHTRSSHNLANFGNDSANTFPPSQSCYPNALGRQSLRVSDHASVSPSGAQQQTPKILAEQGAFRNLTLTNRPSRSRRDSATAGLRNVQPSNSVAGPSTGVRNTARSTNRNPPSNNRRSSDDDLLDESENFTIGHIDVF
ncbi:hypothetical protein EJ03DRAFT_121659 [Teratosphaeria nubilosa]|uniref:Uncharacterized protein n=1 Tax=Teratosphaeria nubilosa TaxID=161662 RepID=A0A6G1L5X7_9PEZI|nr:hypothetical protein EJ03DRAFT_121659 [Teratosphaeria nubilosa]